MGGLIDVFAGGALTEIVLAVLGALLVILAIAALAVRRRRAGERPSASSPRNGRLAVIDIAAVEGDRRLVLVRRDHVEHLILIGGPRDVVVESGILRQRASAPAPGPRPAAPRTAQPQGLRPAAAPAAAAPAERATAREPDQAMQERLRAASTALALRQAAALPGEPVVKREAAPALSGAGVAAAGLAAGVAALTAAAGSRARSEAPPDGREPAAAKPDHPPEERAAQAGPEKARPEHAAAAAPTAASGQDESVPAPAAASGQDESVAAPTAASGQGESAPSGQGESAAGAEQEPMRAVFGLRAEVPTAAGGKSHCEQGAEADPARVDGDDGDAGRGDCEVTETPQPAASGREDGQHAAAEGAEKAAGQATTSVPDAPAVTPPAAHAGSDAGQPQHPAAEAAGQTGQPRAEEAAAQSGQPQPLAEAAGAQPGKPQPPAEEAAAPSGEPGPPAEEAAAEMGEPQRPAEAAAGATGQPQRPVEETAAQPGRPQHSAEGPVAETGQPPPPAEAAPSPPEPRPAAPAQAEAAAGRAPVAAAASPAAPRPSGGPVPLSGSAPGRGTTLGDLAERLEVALIQQAATGADAVPGEPAAAIGETMPPSPAPQRRDEPAAAHPEPRAQLEAQPGQRPAEAAERDEAAIIDFTARRRPDNDSLEEEMARLLGELTRDTSRR